MQRGLNTIKTLSFQWRKLEASSFNVNNKQATDAVYAQPNIEIKTVYRNNIS